MNNPVINKLILNIDRGIKYGNLEYINVNLVSIAIYIINQTSDFSIKYVKYKEQHPYLLVPCGYINPINNTPDKAVIINPETNEKIIINFMDIIDRIKNKTDLIEMYYEIDLFFNYQNEDINDLI